MNPQQGPSYAPSQSLGTSAIAGNCAPYYFEDGVVKCLFCETRVSTDVTIQVTLLKNKELIPPQAERICFACAEFTKLTVKNFVAKMKCHDWKKSPEFRAKIATLTFGRASPPDIIIGFLHRKKICNYCEPPKHIPLMETEQDHIQTFHESISFIFCHRCCERFIRGKLRSNGQPVFNPIELVNHESRCIAFNNIRLAMNEWPKYRLFDADGKISQQSFLCPIKDCRKFCLTDEKLLLHFNDSDHFWIPFKEDTRWVFPTAQDACPFYARQGYISQQFVLTNCEFCDALVLMSDTIEVSNPKEFEGNPIFICTLCADKTKLTVENMADKLNCRGWTISEKVRFFIHSLRIDYDLDGVNPGAVLGFVYKRRKCNICQMHLTLHETVEQHSQKHHLSDEKMIFVVCPKGCEMIIQTGNDLIVHNATCGFYCESCRQYFPKDSLHHKDHYCQMINADGKYIDQVFACPAPGCFFKCKEENLLLDHLQKSKYFWKLMPKSDQYVNTQEFQSLPHISILNYL